MRRLFTFFLALIAGVGTLFANDDLDNKYGYCGAEGDGTNLSWHLNINDCVLTISGTGKMKNYVSTTHGWMEYSFYIKSVVIMDGVTSIGDKAFYFCENLTSVTIPNSVTEIGAKAFRGCEKLTAITIPNSVVSVGDSAFTDFSSPLYNEHVFVYLPTSYSGSYVIPDGIDSIMNTAFTGCSNLTAITIPNSVKSIRRYAFKDCSSLTAVTIPNSITSIGEYAFDGCSSLIAVTIPNGVTEIKAYTFRDCSSLASVTIPKGVTRIGEYAFYKCAALASVTIPNSVTTIGESAFFRNAGMTTLSIGSGIKSIGASAFFTCSALTSITCKAVTPPECPDLMACCWAGIPQSCPVYVPAGSITAYQNVDPESPLMGWKWFEADCFRPIPKGSGTCGDNLTWDFTDGVLTISGTGPMASFETAPWADYRNYIESVVIKKGVTSICASAFANHYEIRSVDIPASVTSVGESAFSFCVNLKELSLMSVGAIPNYLCESCYALEKIYIGVATYISPDAFNMCLKLKSISAALDNTAYSSTGGVLFNKNQTQLVKFPTAKDTYTIPTTITSILASAFDGCQAKPISLTCENSTPPTLTSGNTLFAKVDGSVEAYVPEASISAYKAAWGTTKCTYYGLQYGTCTVNGITYEYHSDGTASVQPATPKYSGDITVPATFVYNNKTYTVTEIGLAAFSYCDNLTSVTLPETIEKISQSFNGSTKLTSLTIPENVTSVNQYAFMGCTGLKVIYFKNYRTVPMKQTSFSSVPADLIIYVPAILLNEYRAQWSEMTNIQPELIERNGLYYLLHEDNQNASVVQHPNGSGGYNTLQNIVIPEAIEAYGLFFSVDTIAKNAFYYCDQVLSIAIPNSVVYIADYAFNSCEDLTTIEIPENVNSIGNYAFQYCTGLTSITCFATTPPECGYYYCFGNVNKSIPLYVPYGTKAAYSAANEWKDFTNIQEMGTPIDPTGFIAYELVDLSTETVTAGQYLIVFDDNKAHAEVSGKDLIASSDELTFEDDYAFVPEEAVCAVTIAPLGTDSFSILLADGKTYMDLQAKNSVTTSEAASGFAITDGGDKEVQIAKYLPSENKTYVLKQNSNYFRMYSSTSYILPKLYRKVAPVTYHIRFLNEDGTVLQESDIESGATPVYEGATPVKDATAQYTYTFTGWDKPIVAASEDIDYTAVFESTLRSYTVTWINGDGTTLVEESYNYGATPIYKGPEPTRPATEQYTYTFNGYWSHSVAPVTGDATYEAQFWSTVRNYTVTWKMDDGSVIDETSWPYGEKPSHADPEKPATAQYEYTFKGWTPEVTAVSGDATYTAVFEETLRSYTVTWVNWDGTELDKETYNYGTTPIYKGTEPTRPATAENTFTFSGWSPAIAAVTGDITYKAQFNSTGQTYTVTWKMDDGSVLATETYAYGDLPNYTDPVKPATAQYEYTFKGWTPEVTAVSGDATYTAVFEETLRSYTVTWVNWDGTELDKETYNYGTTPIYKGTEPTRPATAQYEYTFKGWTPEVAAVSKDATYTAVFEQTLRSYTITFVVGPVNYPVTVEYGTPMNALMAGLWAEAQAEYGFTQDIEGNYQYSDGINIYTFTGWDKEIPETVTGEAAYTATYTITPLQPTAVEEMSIVNCQLSTKFIHDGQIFILRGDKIYTITGQIVK